MVNLTINGKAIEVPEGFTVLQATTRAGITIPTLCDHPNLKPLGGCRLCIVEIQGARTPQASCALLATNGMVVETESPTLTEGRRFLLKLLLSSYYDVNVIKEVPDQKDIFETQFTQWVREYGLDLPSEMSRTPRYPIDSDPNPFIWVDLNKCIRCYRCIRACAEIQGRFVWGTAQRGHDTDIVAGAKTDLLTARCESCGACVAFCPTGALDNKMSVHSGVPDRLVTTTCSYCGVGCQFDLNIKDNRIIRVTSNPNAPVNGMHLCVKGRYGYDYVHHPDRITQPKVRKYLLDGSPRPIDRGEWVETDWETALEITSTKLIQSRDQFGADSIGVLTSAKCLNEENYLMNKFARQVIGTNNIDHCARL